MSGVQNIDVIDLITANPSSGRYTLIMIESRPWDGSIVQLNELAQKFNTYLLFAVDEGLISMYPDAEGKPLRVQLNTIEPPTEAVIQLVEQLRPRFTAHEIEVTIELLSP